MLAWPLAVGRGLFRARHKDSKNQRHCQQAAAGKSRMQGKHAGFMKEAGDWLHNPTTWARRRT
jgi:hypothetical protein